MNLNEKILKKLVCVFILIGASALIFFDLAHGYKSFFIYAIPMIFVIVALTGIFQEKFSIVYNSKLLINPKQWINENSEFVFFILPLSIFSLIGFLLTFFAIKLNWNVGISGWVTISIFALFPLYLIYGFLFGFSISEKQQRQIELRQKKIFSNEKGITIKMPLFDKDCFISWQSIEAIIYYNYIVSSDFTDHYQGFKFYLNTIPTYTKYEKQSWLNKLFSKDSQSKIIDVADDTKSYMEIPKWIEIYLNSKTEVDFNSPLKGTLISSHITKNQKKITTIEKWNPNNKEPEKIIFNRQDLSIEEIKKNFR